MTTTSTDTPRTAPGPDCPGPMILERAIVGDRCDDDLRRHLDACAHCREQAQLIRENLAFMRGISPELVAGVSDRIAPEGELLSGYSIIREVARGGQGVVFEAIHVQTGRRAAIKMIEPDANGTFSGNRRRRIEREAELVASLRHPGIVSLYHCSPLPGGRFALAMEYVDGVPIDAWARGLDERAAGGREAQREAVRTKLRVLCAVCDAVHHAHLNGVIHRDLKPGNVLVGSDGVPRVVDFGVALRASQPRLTRAGGFAGTLAYASPEQVSGDPEAVDARSDVYALGVMLYEILAGRPPYDTSGSLTGAINSITQGAPASLKLVQPGGQRAGTELEAIVGKALQKERSERYQSAAALREDLDLYLSGRPVHARSHTALYLLGKLANRHRWGVAAVLAVVVLLVALAVTALESSRRSQHQGRLLAASLASSTIERGRLIGMSGAGTRAEDLIWPEFIASGAHAEQADLLFEGTSGRRQAAWALVELLARFPSLVHRRVAPGGLGVVFDSSGPDGFRVLRRGGPRPAAADASADAPALSPVSPERAYISTARRHASYQSAQGPVVIDLATGAERVYTHPDLAGLMFFDVSSDGACALFVNRQRGLLQLWSLDPLELRRTLVTDLRATTHGRFSIDGTLVSSASGETIRAWRVSDGEEVGAWAVPADLGPTETRQQVTITRLSPDNSVLVAGVLNNILLFDARRPGTPARRLAPHLGHIDGLDFSADGSILVSCSADRVIRAYDLRTGEVINAFEHGVPFQARMACSPDGTQVGLLDVDDCVRILEIRPGAWMSRLATPGATAQAAAMIPEAGLIAAAASDGHVRFWNARTLETAGEAVIGRAPLTSLTRVPGRSGVLAAAQTGEISRVDVEPVGVGSARATLRVETSPIGTTSVHPTCLACSPDGALLLAGGVGSSLHAFRIGAEGASEVSTVETGHRHRVIHCAFSPDGTRFVTVGGEGVAVVRDARSLGELARTRSIGAQMRALCFSPDGRSFFVGSDDWKIRRFDAATGELLQTIGGVKQHVFGLAMHPSGNVMFSCGRDSDVQVWDTRTGRELAVLQGHSDMILSLSLDARGERLLTASADQSVGVWDLDHYLRHIRGNAEYWAQRAQTPKDR